VLGWQARVGRARCMWCTAPGGRAGTVSGWDLTIHGSLCWGDENDKWRERLRQEWEAVLDSG
jgi:hypothetical protein